MAPVEVTEDYYAILEVEYTATVEVIIKSYRRLAKTLHPDKNPNKPDATACFQRVSIFGMNYNCVALRQLLTGITSWDWLMKRYRTP